MRVLALALAAVTLAVVLVPGAPAAPPALAAIQPGGPFTEFFFPGGITTAHCTLGFILRDGSGTWYALTAAHCTSVGATPFLTATGGAYGVVVVDDDMPSEGGPAGGMDVALIRINPSKVGLISPAVRGYGGPTGIATPATAAPGDALLLTGYNNGFGYRSPQQLNVNQLQYAQHGAGILSHFDGPNYHSIDSSVDGYSGGPVVMADDGQALGLVSATVGHVVVGVPGIDRGPTVAASLGRLSSVYGYALTLQAAPFSGVSPI